MSKKLTKIVGLKKTDFDSFVEEKAIFVRPARLIPAFKPGDEMALTSIFLSALRLIKEFRYMISSTLRFSKSGKVFYYTEVSFSDIKDIRLDGLIILVSGGIIKDAAFLEVKNKKNQIDPKQIEKYQNLANQYGVPRVITISNEFVPDPTLSPINIKPLKNVALYHFSWSYLLTIAHILLFKNDTNIEDEDQVNIMREVIFNFENDDSGIFGFTKMMAGWKEVVDKINAGTGLKYTDKCLNEAIVSWQQEERDMALILSRKLGVFVDSGSRILKENLKTRLSGDIKSLVEKKTLTSVLSVKGAVSDILVQAFFEKRTIVMSVKVSAPLDKGIKGRFGWISRQIEYCQKKDKETFESLKNELMIDLHIKYISKSERISYDKIDSLYENLKTKEITDFGVLLVKDFGKNFSSTKKFVEIIEEMLFNFYKCIVQYLDNWKQPAPKLTDQKNVEEQSSKG